MGINQSTQQSRVQAIMIAPVQVLPAVNMGGSAEIAAVVAAAAAAAAAARVAVAAPAASDPVPAS